MAESLEQQLRALVRDVPEFPKPGILFRDLTPVMRDLASGNPAHP